MKTLVTVRLTILVVLCSLCLYGCGNKVSDRFNLSTSSSLIDKGSYLANGIAWCGFCHAIDGAPFSPLAGGRQSKDLYGDLFAPNITPSQSGIGYLSDEQIVSSIRGNWSKDHDKRSPDIHRGYEWMSTKDALSLVAYLKSLTPIKNSVEVRKVGFTSRNTTGFFSQAPIVSGYIAQISEKHKAHYGKYLINHVARCGFCHNTAGSVFKSEVYLGGNENAPPLLGPQSNIKDKDKDIRAFFTQGRLKDRAINSALCPTNFFKNIESKDLEAIVEYFKTLD